MGVGGKRLDRDAAYALEIAYCSERGLSRAALREWSDADRIAVLTHYQRERNRCTCGSFHDDWIDPKTGRKLPVEEQKWEVVTIECYGCAEIEREREAAKPKPGIFRGLRRKLGV